ncbi:MAG: response regulator transcription factor [Arhodomonas sp.]|nr:response regulator transcription factor [Arhodomonas sp.]
MTVGDGASALRAWRDGGIDLVILDLMLPDRDGLSVCREVRASGSYVPDPDADRALERSRPRASASTSAPMIICRSRFGVAELTARVKALFRAGRCALDRLRRPSDPGVIEHDGLVIDPARRKVEVDGRPVELTAMEFNLLHHFAAHPGLVFSRVQLLGQGLGLHLRGLRAHREHPHQPPAVQRSSRTRPIHATSARYGAWATVSRSKPVTRTLYAKLALGLAGLLVAVGLLYAFISTTAFRQHQDAAVQQLNRELARDLVFDRNLVEEGELNEQALKDTFELYMTIHPGHRDLPARCATAKSCRIQPTQKIKRERVSLGPIRRMLAGFSRTTRSWATIPRDREERKIFSVAPLPVGGGRAGISLCGPARRGL